MERRGHLQITYGPMFSEKTSSLVQNIRNKHIISRIKGEEFKGVVVNHTSDVREKTDRIANLTTHNKLISPDAFPEEIEFIQSFDLQSVKHKLMKYDHISIDECQFFGDIVETVLELLEEGKDIHLVGLISDSERKPFGKLADLFYEADNLEQKKAYCVYCKGNERNASFTKYIGGEGKDDSVKVGASGDYVPCCRYHFYE